MFNKMVIPTNGGGTKCSSGYIATNVPSTITTKDNTTGETFEPKFIIITTYYANSSYMDCIYDKDISTTSYIRRQNNAEISLPIPRTENYGGIDNITETGFTLHAYGDMTKFYYTAIG